MKLGEAWVVVHHRRRREHLTRTTDGLLARINQEDDGRVFLWILEEAVYQNSWSEAVYVQGREFYSVGAAKAAVTLWAATAPEAAF